MTELVITLLDKIQASCILASYGQIGHERFIREDIGKIERSCRQRKMEMRMDPWIED